MPLRRARRALAPLLLATLVATLTPVATTGSSSATPRPHPVDTAMRSTALAALPAARARALQARAAAESGVVDLRGRLHVVGVTWPQGAVAEGAEVEIRERTDGRWGAWTELHHDADHAPDAGTDEAARARAGTDPWVSTADAVQARVVSPAPLEGQPRLDVVDPGASAADEPAAAAAGSASAQGVRPTIYSRAQWGADESLRAGGVSYGRVKAAVVHHTAGSNSYTADQVPGIIRGIYRYHVTGNGWNDIGYNFLVDKFGRIWEGRYGGTDKPVIGAHAYGVNSQTYGAAILGEFTSTVPTSASLTAQAKLAAWKLSLHYVDPTATTTLDGYGTEYTINGHRDTFSTSCPGTQVYSRLSTIRSQARQYQGTMFYGPRVSASSVPYGGGGVAVSATANSSLTWRMTVTSPCRTTAVARSSGSAARGASFTATWSGRFSDGTSAPPGTYTVTLTASNGTGTLATAMPVSYDVTVRDATGAPPGLCPPRLGGANRFAVAVNTAVAQNPSSTTVVLVNGREAAMADALVAAPLARRLGGVLLLADQASLPADTEREIVRRRTTRVQIVGGEGSVGQAVVSRLKALGVSRVDRIGGASRYDVAASVAREVAGSAGASRAMIASGSSTAMADGLGLSGPAAALGRPILLVAPTSVPAVTADALRDLGVRETVVAGGPATVPDSVMAQLPSPRRLGGADRFAVSTTIASWAAANGVSPARVLVASGRNEALADTLSGGQLGRVTLYVTPTAVPTVVDDWLQRTTALEEVTVLGGTGSVSLTTGGVAQQAVLD